jgi:uncharacterized repeat protein (TIGR03803 family)
MQRKSQYPPSILALMFLAITFSLAVRAQAQRPDAPTEKIIRDFPIDSLAPNSPSGGLISDAAGNFYGVTSGGGSKQGSNGLGFGTVFEMSPTAEGGWKTKVLYKFKEGTDGQEPIGGLVMDSSGNLYGTTQYGGTNMCTDDFDNFSCGTIFELSPNGSGGWSEKILYNFSQNDGYAPISSMVMDAAGNLYGTTGAGGAEGDALALARTAFELRHSGGTWIYSLLHSFGLDGTDDGAGPSGPLVWDKAGNLYGETVAGGGTASHNSGTIFELSKTSNGWNEKILFVFNSDGTGASGLQPNGGLIFDSAGNLYGTTYAGGIGYGFGTVFELTPMSGGTWHETVLHSFLSNGNNEANPAAGLTLDSAGNLYGTTYFGGSAQAGNAFVLKPSANGAWTYLVMHTFQGYPTDGQGPNSSLFLDSKGNLYGTTANGGPGGGGTVFEIRP